MNNNKSKCKKCGCQEFKWNYVSAVQKAASGGEVSVEGKVIGPGGVIKGKGVIQGQPIIDNKSDQAAYRNCMCGHHINYHC